MNTPVKYIFNNRLKHLLLSFVFIGICTLGIGFIFDTTRTWFSFLVSSLFVLFLSLGALFFISIQHVSRAGWSVNIRRVMEGMASYIPLGSLLAFLLLFSGEHLYSWFSSEQIAQDRLLIHKSPYLNFSFFAIRLIIYACIWIFFYKKLISFSLNQDKTGDEQWTHKSYSHSVAFLILFSLSFTFFTVDTLMALEPHWFSTVFGVYSFGGLFQSFLAVCLLLLIYLRKKGFLTDQWVNANHLHDLGKFLLGFTVFWAYIAFSQYMLVWYANLPEEATYYLHRSQHSWMWVSLSLIVFKFIVPFIYLLPRWVKRDEGALTLVCILILIMQFIDIYWMAYPNYDTKHLHFGLIELGTCLGFIGLFLYTILNFLSKHPLVPIKDPRQDESLKHHVTY